MMVACKNSTLLFIVIALEFAVLVRPTMASLWFLSQLKLWSLGAEGSNLNLGNFGGKSRALCDFIPNLSKRQKKLCETHANLIPLIGQGALRGVEECKFQFRNQRWNCTTIKRDGVSSGPIISKPGTREAAFIYAITSAGIVHTVAKGCSTGTLQLCGCANRPIGRGKDEKGEFQWAGCSDDVRFATSFTRKFVDAPERRNRDPMALMNLHNNRAGRKAVRSNIKKECKCHGISGSCTTRTCFRTLGNFHTVGALLRVKYREAAQVTTHPDGGRLIPANLNERQLDAVMGRAGSPTAAAAAMRRRRLRREHSVPKSSLVYFEASPDYCVADSKTGSPGTVGRPCNRSSTGPESCDVMCCGRGYNTKTELQSYQCQCKFVWCCDVQCKTCTKQVEIYTCKAEAYRNYNEAVQPYFPYRRDPPI